MPRHEPRPCEGCHREYAPVRKAQKLCRPCRLLDDLDYWHENAVKASKCAECAELFFRTNRSTRLCAICDPGYPNRAALECLTCGSKDQGLERSHTPVCRHCARAPDKGLRRLVRERLRQHLGRAPVAWVNPLYQAAIEAADAAAQRLGITREVSLRRAKSAMGLDPDTGTKDYEGLRAALEVL